MAHRHLEPLKLVLKLFVISVILVALLFLTIDLLR